MMKKIDIIASLIIGEAAAWLMLFIGRNIDLPAEINSILPFLPFVFPLFTLGVMLFGSLLARRLGLAYQLTKFALVGGLNFLIDLGVLNILIFATGITSGFYAATFKAVAFLIAVGSSFLWNKFWTFRALSVEHVGLQFAEFFAVTVIGFFINVGGFELVNDFVGPRGGVDPTTWASIAAGGAAIIGLVWNFAGYKFIVFRKPAG